MSSFFKRQPELFDTKQLGTNQGSGSNLAAAGLALTPTAVASAQSTEDVDSAPENNPVESWVELAPSRASLCSSIEAVLVESTSGGDNSVNKDSRLSPVSLQSPHVEFESSLEQVKYRLVKDMLPFADGTKSTDWLWDWSNRSENGAAAQKVSRHRSGGQIGSTLTTPPNSPEPESSEFDFKSKSSNRSIKKKAENRPSTFTKAEVIFGLVFSNLMTFFLGAAIGYCICRKMIYKGSDPFEDVALAYYYS